MSPVDSNDDDDHVYMMFSATFPKEARSVARKYMAKDHVRVRIGRTGSTHANVEQKVPENISDKCGHSLTRHLGHLCR